MALFPCKVYPNRSCLQLPIAWEPISTGVSARLDDISGVMTAAKQIHDQTQVFKALKTVLQSFADELTVKEDTETSYYLETKAGVTKGSRRSLAP